VEANLNVFRQFSSAFDTTTGRIRHCCFKPFLHSSISPPPGEKIEKEITFLHSFATEEMCSASLVVKNVQLL
jgi:hypothetical protein